MKKTVIISTQPLAKNNHSAFVFIIRYLAKNIPNTILLDDNFDQFREEIIYGNAVDKICNYFYKEAKWTNQVN